MKAVVIVCSDSVAAGRTQDTTGPVVAAVAVNGLAPSVLEVIELVSSARFSRAMVAEKPPPKVAV